ncbi:MAG TPA: type II secretion system protein F, partial [Ornithinibacter sp.]|nr:type II secretion system protein F [Ornithinibacter sp.]
MTGLLLGLTFGVGIFLIWWSLWVPTPREPRSVTRVGPLERLSDEIVQAGFTGLTVRTLIAACVIAFVLVLAFVQAAVGVLP